MVGKTILGEGLGMTVNKLAGKERQKQFGIEEDGTTRNASSFPALPGRESFLESVVR